MKLDANETLALKLIFKGDDELSAEIRSKMELITVIGREYTGPGFFSDLKLPRPLVAFPEVKMRQFIFNHPVLPYGGSFDCYFDENKKDILEIEGVTFGGVAWPDLLEEDLISEMI